MDAEDQGTQDPTVGELAEAEILGRILARFESPGTDVRVGPGDDAAVVEASGAVVVTTDTLVHGPDFRLAWSSAFDLGWKAAAVNLADVAAMGARPTALFVALAMPSETRVSFVEGLADGLRGACEALAPGCGIAGGDLTVSPTLTIAVTALGSLDGRAAVLRSGARPGDVVTLAGEAGAAARGLALLFERFTDAAGEPMPVKQAVLDPLEAECVGAQLRPSPPIGLGIVAAEAGATALMDVSDGLALDATRMAAASAVVLDLETANLGPHRAWAVTGGEDHALLATFPAGVPLPHGFRVIGRVSAADVPGVRIDGAAYEGPAGWDPYRDWDANAG